LISKFCAKATSGFNFFLFCFSAFNTTTPHNVPDNDVNNITHGCVFSIIEHANNQQL